MTACYNHDAYIEETIKSVISQEYPNLEYIVIDDGSTDSSWRVINKFRSEISKVIRLDGYRPGPVEALNLGFSHADGAIFGWLNSDDVLLPNSLFTVGQIFRDYPDTSWTSGLASTLNHDGHLINCQVRRKHLYDFLSGDWRVLQQESTFFRRELFESAGGKLDESYRQAFDLELWTRFFECAPLHFIEAPIGAFRRGPQSMSTRARDELESYAATAIGGLRERHSSIDKLRASLWSVLKSPLLKGLWLSIPNKALLKLFPRFVDRVYYFDVELSQWRHRGISSLRRV